MDDVCFSVRAGEIFGVLGRNGAGKTTTVECLPVLWVHDGGRLDVLGLGAQEGRRLHVESGFKLSERLVEEGANVRCRVVVEGDHDSDRHSHHSTGEGSQG